MPILSVGGMENCHRNIDKIRQKIYLYKSYVSQEGGRRSNYNHVNRQLKISLLVNSKIKENKQGVDNTWVLKFVWFALVILLNVVTVVK